MATTSKQERSAGSVPPMKRRARQDRLPKLGRRRTDRSRAVLPIRLTGAVPPHPLVDDNLAKVPAWNGATNFSFGTCGPVTIANAIIATWAYLQDAVVAVTDDAIYDFYARSGNPDFDPDTGAGDNGVDMTVMMAELVRNGIDVTMPGGPVKRVRALCFGTVDAGLYDDLHATTSIFGGFAGGSDLDVAQQSQPDLWDYSPSPAWGGHATWMGAYTSAIGTHARDIDLITWMTRCGTTPSFISHQLGEAYAIVFQPLWDHPAFAEGVDRYGLVADFEAVTGRPWTGPDPGPAPEPPPPPPGAGPDALTRAYLGNPDMLRWARARHVGRKPGSNRWAADQFLALRKAEGVGS
jgi:hypothetical protein